MMSVRDICYYFFKKVCPKTLRQCKKNKKKNNPSFNIKMIVVWRKWRVGNKGKHPKALISNVCPIYILQNKAIRSRIPYKNIY